MGAQVVNCSVRHMETIRVLVILTCPQNVDIIYKHFILYNNIILACYSRSFYSSCNYL